MYYCQRRPVELGAFYWVVDGKDKDKVTDWEDWWSQVIMPITESKSLRKPLGIFSEGDYYHFKRFETQLSDHLKQHANDPSHDEADVRMLLTEHFRFSSKCEAGLEQTERATGRERGCQN